ncbi:MAG: hypothetical protein J4473_02465 [Candidatus Aenigmarchaeota archaeon]|nr:hypothetical protein [Candidatus Aenigmarchaeota archaeon]
MSGKILKLGSSAIIVKKERVNGKTMEVGRFPGKPIGLKKIEEMLRKLAVK